MAVQGVAGVPVASTTLSVPAAGPSARLLVASASGSCKMGMAWPRRVMVLIRTDPVLFAGKEKLTTLLLTDILVRGCV